MEYRMSQYSFDFLPRYTKAKWMFTVLCTKCLRIFELPASVFLQGDPFCACGAKPIIKMSEPWDYRSDIPYPTWYEKLIIFGLVIISYLFFIIRSSNELQAIGK
jgi:hypothetical protein